MSKICKWFGHYIKPYTYGKLYGDVIDGIDTHHGYYQWECERCGEKISLYVHFPSDVKTEYQWEKSKQYENKS